MRRDHSHQRRSGRYRRPDSFTSTNGPLPTGEDVMLGYVDDPNHALRGKKQRTAINTRTDALETEYAHGRVSEEAYRAGRIYQRILERAGGKPSAGGQWMEGDRVDAATAHERAIVRAIDTARKATEMIDDLLPVIGVFASNVLRLTLLDRRTIAEAAALCEGSSGRMQVSYYAETFRRSLQLTADHWAKGREPV